jgi:DNA-binding response OmpR family regulator
MKVLVVDDHQNIIDAVTLCIKLRWPTTNVLASYDGQSGLDMVRDEGPDIVILDIGLPEMDGFAVLDKIRQISHVPVIMLTVRDSDIDIARALEMGADDYISKPFSHVEFLARMEAVLRRTSGRTDSKERPLVAGDLWADFEGGEVLVNHIPIQLTSTELRLLRHLMYNAGRVVTHDSMVNAIWGVNYGEEMNTDTIKVHIRHLRAKLGDNATSPKYIVSVRGIGYKFLKQVTPGQSVEPETSDQSTSSVR